MMNQTNSINIIPSLEKFCENRENSSLTVLSGGNNSGKTFILKKLKEKFGKYSYIIGSNRFSHVHYLSNGTKNPNELDDLNTQFYQEINQDGYNREQNYLDLPRIIQNLNDEKRNELFKICGSLIGCTFSLKQVDETNILSQRYIDMDGQYLSFGSSGTRLLMTILGICMDERFEVLLIDEPELGLSPKIQYIFSNFLQNQDERNKYFPHLKHVIIATHSHLFLNRTIIKDNFSIEKYENNIFINPIETINNFHKLQFNLLGNSFESMFFPSAIVIVEGGTDHEYIEKILELKFPDKRISVIPVHGDGNIKKEIHRIKNIFGDLQKSPFKNRLFVILDKNFSIKKQDLIIMGLVENNVITWDKNGIEYYYPIKILGKIFNSDESGIQEEITIKKDTITCNGISKTKSELKKEVLKDLTGTLELNEEFQSKFLTPLKNAII